MKDNRNLFQTIRFIALSSIGGLVLSLTGLSIGWIIGTLIMAALLSITKPQFLKLPEGQQGISRKWMNVGQLILAIELGQSINLSVLHTLRDNWNTIVIMLVFSIILSLLSGFVLWKFSNTDMLTSLFGTAPGGIAAMPSIAEELGANTAVVSIIQTMRIFLVIFTVPILASSWYHNHVEQAVSLSNPATITAPEFELSQLLWTALLALGAWAGIYVAKYVKIPAPWLVGGMIGAASVQMLSTFISGHEMIAWWPNLAMILSQIFIASCVGSRFYKGMFEGIRKTLIISLFSTLALIMCMLLCALFVAKVTGISLLTSLLAFAPGGVAEMATTAAVLNADATFVVAVQVLRIVVVCITLPPLFRLLNSWEVRRMKSSRLSA
ncbi:AbrB family transcriptional regulator [Peribacillus glennii]|uniref:AbrB family transcriptional regulator n=1 Tax=Peribacillus glennii TaxID=2303991 RepID=UPI0018F129E3|nr:AbrB family transcriptional regulator [Peribacillus glennii]